MSHISIRKFRQYKLISTSSCTSTHIIAAATTKQWNSFSLVNVIIACSIHTRRGFTFAHSLVELRQGGRVDEYHQPFISQSFIKSLIIFEILRVEICKILYTPCCEYIWRTPCSVVLVRTYIHHVNKLRSNAICTYTCIHRWDSRSIGNIRDKFIAYAMPF